MREGCSCNAWVRGSARQVLRWRAEHRCPDRTADAPEIDDRGSATTELASIVPIGFHVQPTNVQSPFEGDDGEDE